MNKQEELALCLFEINREFLKEKVPNIPEWSELDNVVKIYWMALAEGALEIMAEPDSVMLGAVLKEYRKPTAVEKGATWEQQRVSEFTRVYQAALESAKTDWKSILKKK